MFLRVTTPRSVGALQQELRQLIVRELAPAIIRSSLLSNHGSGFGAQMMQTQADAIAHQSGRELREALLAMGRAG
jgi:hypothetical protein